MARHNAFSFAGLGLNGVIMRILSLILALSFFLSACETVKGVGRDVESAGEALDDAIND
ncbi:entericidin A/B family lipoprotein [Hyphococcus sp. DH-69]|uniref:entericidin A/B family lipoprotein n=1 Tax=Hyphococcus formosus TaxID=3143534 RepID=UPI00398BAE40